MLMECHTESGGDASTTFCQAASVEGGAAVAPGAEGAGGAAGAPGAAGAGGHSTAHACRHVRAAAQPSLSPDTET